MISPNIEFTLCFLKTVQKTQEYITEYTPIRQICHLFYLHFKNRKKSLERLSNIAKNIQLASYGNRIPDPKKLPISVINDYNHSDRHCIYFLYFFAIRIVHVLLSCVSLQSMDRTEPRNCPSDLRSMAWPHSCLS